MEQKLNYLLADDHPLFRQALRRVIEQLGVAKTLFEAATGDEAIALLATDKIDIIFLDYSMPGKNGYDTAEIMLNKHPDIKIIVLTLYDEIPVILNFFKLGVRGFLTKNADEKEIAQSIHAVVNDNYYYHSRFDTIIGKWLSDGLTKAIPSIRFTERNMQMILLMSKGKSTQEISEEMKLSTRSIETYRYQLLRSLKLNNTLELLTYVYKNGIV